MKYQLQCKEFKEFNEENKKIEENELYINVMDNINSYFNIEKRKAEELNILSRWVSIHIKPTAKTDKIKLTIKEIIELIPKYGNIIKLNNKEFFKYLNSKDDCNRNKLMKIIKDRNM